MIFFFNVLLIKGSGKCLYYNQFAPCSNSPHLSGMPSRWLRIYISNDPWLFLLTQIKILFGALDTIIFAVFRSILCSECGISQHCPENEVTIFTGCSTNNLQTLLLPIRSNYRRALTPCIVIYRRNAFWFLLLLF